MWSVAFGLVGPQNTGLAALRLKQYAIPTPVISKNQGKLCRQVRINALTSEGRGSTLFSLQKSCNGVNRRRVDPAAWRPVCRGGGLTEGRVRPGAGR